MGVTLLFQAEARLAQRRQARAEAREIRMRELERQQKEQEHNADRVFDMHGHSSASPGGGGGGGNGGGAAACSGGGVIDPIARTRLSMSNSGVGVRGTSMSSRRSSEDSLEEEGRSLRDIRHELKVGHSDRHVFKDDT